MLIKCTIFVALCLIGQIHAFPGSIAEPANRAPSSPHYLQPAVKHNGLTAQTEAGHKKKVYFITSMFNRAKLFDICAQSMAALSRSDPDIFWIIVDYGTPGRDVEKIVTDLGIPNEVVTKDLERFSRVLGLQHAMEMVPADNDIVIAMDLLRVPLDMSDRIRSNVIPQKQVYTPVVLKLAPGEPVESTNGEFYNLGWGVVAFIKEDAMNFFGWDGACRHSPIDIYKWGCEDVMFVRQLATQNIMAVRHNLTGLVHYTMTDEEKHLADAELPQDLIWKKYNEGENLQCYQCPEDYNPIKLLSETVQTGAPSQTDRKPVSKPTLGKSAAVEVANASKVQQCNHSEPEALQEMNSRMDKLRRHAKNRVRNTYKEQELSTLKEQVLMATRALDSMKAHIQKEELLGKNNSQVDHAAAPPQIKDSSVQPVDLNR